MVNQNIYIHIALPNCFALLLWLYYRYRLTRFYICNQSASFIMCNWCYEWCADFMWGNIKYINMFHQLWTLKFCMWFKFILIGDKDLLILHCQSYDCLIYSWCNHVICINFLVVESAGFRYLKIGKISIYPMLRTDSRFWLVNNREIWSRISRLTSSAWDIKTKERHWWRHNDDSDHRLLSLPLR